MTLLIIWICCWPITTAVCDLLYAIKLNLYDDEPPSSEVRCVCSLFDLIVWIGVGVLLYRT